MKYISYDKLCIAFSLLKLPYIQHGSKFLQCTFCTEIKSSGRRKTSCTHVPKFVHVYIYSKQNRCWTNKQTKTMNLMENLPVYQWLLFWPSQDIVSITSPYHTIDKKKILALHRLRQKKKLLYRSMRNHYQYLLLQKNQ